MSSETKLWNGSFLAACITNFFYQFGRYFLVPIIALYLIDTWQANKTEVGFVLAGFSVSMMIIRPFCGFLADTLDRRRLYRGALVAFAAIFFAYPFAATMTTFAALQIAHGFALGVLAVIANTLVIDITPSQRRGEALGFYGIMNNIAMALAPMMAIWIHHHFGYLARHDQRGTASATYMTTWDVGIGAGMLFGGMLADVTPFAYVFLVGAVCALLSSVLWHTFTMRHYLTHRLS